MTRPRSEIVDRENGGFYHLGSRCVRRAMLCGKDPDTGRDFSHRRTWIEDRLLELADIFTVHVCTYVVMSNHYHITLNYTPQERLELADEVVARRWLQVFPPKRPDDIEPQVGALLNDPERLAELRDRLGDLSWYMRCLNEPIARRANLEDDCTGRFWQGRFRSKDAPDERSVWACMAYDDLNPIRAGMAEQVDEQEHTSLQRRLEEAEAEPELLDEPMAPLVRREGKVASAPPPAPRLDMTLREYRAHVEWTGGILHDAPAPAPKERAPPARMGDPKSWLDLVVSCRQRTPATTLPRWVRATA
ncbi:MAG: hypothetical protein J4F38_02890 [Pseudomonadales bacterium]|nr:hypothetical protein [Pseudomonadales bacterium]